eukprot:GGOE01023270.1.p1 GENE.GGOE01023270.1~~GGOE01023270.1.p1  ORF type:complete len:537 (-),score=43.49 GGOE01023270.1:525-2135(-)
MPKAPSPQFLSHCQQPVERDVHSLVTVQPVPLTSNEVGLQTASKNLVPFVSLVLGQCDASTEGSLSGSQGLAMSWKGGLRSHSTPLACSSGHQGTPPNYSPEESSSDSTAASPRTTRPSCVMEGKAAMGRRSLGHKSAFLSPSNIGLAQSAFSPHRGRLCPYLDELHASASSPTCNPLSRSTSPCSLDPPSRPEVDHLLRVRSPLPTRRVFAPNQDHAPPFHSLASLGDEVEVGADCPAGANAGQGLPGANSQLQCLPAGITAITATTIATTTVAASPLAPQVTLNTCDEPIPAPSMHSKRKARYSLGPSGVGGPGAVAWSRFPRSTSMDMKPRNATEVCHSKSKTRRSGACCAETVSPRLAESQGCRTARSAVGGAALTYRPGQLDKTNRGVKDSKARASSSPGKVSTGTTTTAIPLQSTAKGRPVSNATPLLLRLAKSPPRRPSGPGAPAVRSPSERLATTSPKLRSRSSRLVGEALVTQPQIRREKDLHPAAADQPAVLTSPRPLRPTRILTGRLSLRSEPCAAALPPNLQDP